MEKDDGFCPKCGAGTADNNRMAGSLFHGQPQIRRSGIRHANTLGETALRLNNELLNYKRISRY